jgi:mRNA-degrading endonuclease HigB of HigAB toxin-antitoxin module
MQSTFFEIIDDTKNILDISGKKYILVSCFLFKIKCKKDMKVTSIILNIIIHFRTFMIVA